MDKRIPLRRSTFIAFLLIAGLFQAATMSATKLIFGSIVDNNYFHIFLWVTVCVAASRYLANLCVLYYVVRARSPH